MTDIASLLPGELKEYLAALGEPEFRAGQLFKWLASGARSYGEMTNLPKSLREKLEQDAPLHAPALLRKQVSAADGTIKYLWELRDGNAVETVVMRYKHGNTVCISTQAGCRMGCAFCASTIGGLVRNLTAGEMLGEVLASERDSGGRISNIVLMGIGEPLDNYDNVLRFLRLVNHPDGPNIGMRHVTLSTCGLTERIDELAGEDLQLTLAVSLHSASDRTRDRLMPVNRGRGVEELISACERYFECTGRRVTFEYAMIDGVNDTPDEAGLLARAARRAGAHVNLIPLNHVEESGMKPSTGESMKAFTAVLDKNGVNYTLRRRLGGDVDASCGQLRRKRENDRR